MLYLFAGIFTQIFLTKRPEGVPQSRTKILILVHITALVQQQQNKVQNGNRSWDTVFYIKETGANIGIRLYYFADTYRQIIHYQGELKEYGVLETVYPDNPSKGDQTTDIFEFKVVASDSYIRKDPSGSGSKQKCIDVRVDAFKNTTTKTPLITTSATSIIDDGADHTTTLCIPFGNNDDMPSSSSSSSPSTLNRQQTE